VPVLWVPLAALVPLQLPLAVHDVGLLVADQVILALLPAVMEIGLRASVTTGTGGSDTTRVTLLLYPVPPALVHDKL